jgi:hypothetical protein
MNQRIVLAALLALACVTTSTLAQQGAPKKPDPKAVAADIAAHRALAQVHENAAKCLESGKSEKECHDQVAKECKGVGIGKYCGLRHRH